MRFMVLLFIIVALFGVTTNSSAEDGIFEDHLGVMDPQKKAKILELHKKCKSVQGLPAEQAKANAGLTDKQLAACPKIIQKVEAARAKAQKNAAAATSQQPASSGAAGSSQTPATSAKPGASQSPAATKPAATQKPSQAAATTKAATDAAKAAKQQKIQKLLELFKAKQDKLSDAQKAKCAKLQKKATQQTPASTKAAKAATSKPTASTEKAKASTEKPKETSEPKETTTEEPKDATQGKAAKKETEEIKQQSADDKLKEANKKLQKAKELNKLASKSKPKKKKEAKKVDSEKVSKDFQKEQDKVMKHEEKMMEEDKERLESGCYRKNVFYATEDLYFFKGVESSFKCQLKCGQLDGCEYFSWHNKDAVSEGKKTPNLCLLKAKKPAEDTRRENVISGPKQCGKGKQKEFEEAGNEDSSPLPTSLIYVALSPQFVIVGSCAIFAFGLVASRTLCYTRRKPRGSDNSSDLIGEETETEI